MRWTRRWVAVGLVSLVVSGLPGAAASAKGFPGVGDIGTVAGTGGKVFNGDGLDARLTNMNPQGIAVAPSGDVYVAIGYWVLRIDATTGIVTTVAGNGAYYSSEVDNVLATATPVFADDLALDSDGNLYISEPEKHKVRMVDASNGKIYTVAGTGGASTAYNGDDIAATAANLSRPVSIAVDSDDNLYIADTWQHRVRMVDVSNGKIYTIAGTGTHGYNGENVTATSAQLNYPVSVAVDGSGNVFIGSSYSPRVQEVVAATGKIKTVVGTGVTGDTGDGGDADAAQIGVPVDLAIDDSGNLYLADGTVERVRKVDHATGKISALAGTGVEGFNGDGKPAAATMFDSLSNIELDLDGSLLISDSGNRRLRILLATFTDSDADGVEDRVDTFRQVASVCHKVQATIMGTDAGEVIPGTPGDDVIMALGGADEIDAGDGNDIVCAGDGHDSVTGGPGKDKIYGDAGPDVASGSSGNDRLYGGGGDDDLRGGKGRDRLSGGGGYDTLDGGGSSHDRCDGESEINCELPW